MVTEAAAPDVKKLVATDIDAYNVLAVLRGKFWGLTHSDISDLIVTTTPKVTQETLQKMINMLFHMSLFLDPAYDHSDYSANYYKWRNLGYNVHSDPIAK